MILLLHLSVFTGEAHAHGEFIIPIMKATFVIYIFAVQLFTLVIIELRKIHVGDKLCFKAVLLASSCLAYFSTWFFNTGSMGTVDSLTFYLLICLCIPIGFNLVICFPYIRMVQRKAK